jgi:photosystem II stability/assembly factor-like uncharacterized protein
MAKAKSKVEARKGGGGGGAGAAAKKAKAPKRGGQVRVFVGTRKGLWTLTSDAKRRQWDIEGPAMLGAIVHHVVQDPRDRKSVLMASRTGHLGPTLFRSQNGGKKWKEVSKPPAFPKVPEGEKGWVVDHTFWLTPGHESEPGVWWAGTSPQGLFRSADGGDTWEGVPGFNENPMREAWFGGLKDMTPDGGKMHSILVDPRDKNHMYIGMSGGGVFESKNQGATWAPLNKGCSASFNPDPDPEYGHDPHHVALHPLMPDRLYQQNHEGIYKLERPTGRWERIGKKMPKKVGDVGFPIVLHPRDPDTVWVFPMDGSGVWPRTSVGGKPAAFVTRNAGRTWKRQGEGLPKEQAWWTVKRQAMAGDARDPVGLYFGTTSGEIWASRDEGAKWKPIARHLPHVYSVTVAEL